MDVVITGLGVVTPVGNSIPELWNKLLNGESGIKKISKFKTDYLKTQIAGEIREFKFGSLKEKYSIDFPVSIGNQYLLAAIDEAVNDSGLNDVSNALFFAGSGGKSKLLKPEMFRDVKSFFSIPFEENVRSSYSKEFYDNLFFETENNRTVSLIAKIFKLKKIPFNMQVACATGAQTVNLGFEAIRQGLTDIVVCCAVQTIDIINLIEFTLLEALSTYNDKPEKASRPFDLTRNGFVISEGAGTVIIESKKHALKRNARIYAGICGSCVTNDAYRLTDPHPQGLYAARAIEKAIDDAGLHVNKIDYINAHGTSTVANDKCETGAIKQAFKDYCHNIKINASKSILGHMILAAGIIETIITALSIYHQIIHPTINLYHDDPECDLDYCKGSKGFSHDIRYALSNSFGFGGQNVVLVLKKWQ